ncbi:DUF1707 SHOCT-like domain-containing protein [Streptomyces sp. JH002]|uniref:DUF1707 SHOCT-like domain-containing protein n=1 Tax=Streptomyces sp. JH002 TaxID=2763259 RepID=UPI003D805FC8
MTSEKPPAVPLAKPAAPAPVPHAGPDSVRASDADRDGIADILREALAEGRLDAEEHSERIESVYRAKTLGELEPLIRDLPAGQRTAPPPPGPAPHHSPPHGRQVMVPEGPRNVVAVFSAANRAGRWRIGLRTVASAVFGSVELDLTEAIFDQPYVTIDATAVFGSVEIKVPENVTVRTGGTGVLGSFEVVEMVSGDPGAPVIMVKGAAVFGSVEARPVPGKAVRNLRNA